MVKFNRRQLLLRSFRKLPHHYWKATHRDFINNYRNRLEG
ncbi:hypothetical protein CSB93_4584 [Pseudomonas paraeruginosa]|uniref:Uncharacterized protein n=1 Tax=Pseudomonas paraeruginosa TaxID=2994495 RepID=A0A2R3J267_9PSED|nr:hypothetical protein CSB93_4584 [Pseudomonas paraeruginosa]AWE90708.1 hypothetical protein CSC28_3372 [Pseudomonas paraeruginosa]